MWLAIFQTGGIEYLQNAQLGLVIIIDVRNCLCRTYECLNKHRNDVT